MVQEACVKFFSFGNENSKIALFSDRVFEEIFQALGLSY
jgi:hypothetical protein